MEQFNVWFTVSEVQGLVKVVAWPMWQKRCHKR